ncbi:MAG: phage tail protein, partial [Terriglobia bacterium]
EWDALVELFVNGVEWDVSSPENIQFHKGLSGERSSFVDENGVSDVLYPEGVGSLYPFTENGDQKVDSLTPAGVQGLTFSRTAYLALRIPFDVFAPGPDLSVVAVFRTRKVRIFDAQGVQTGYQYSDNPAWQIADLLTTVRGLADSRIDWASFVAAANTCNQLIDPIGDGTFVPRFVSHIAFTEEADFDQGLAALLATCRGLLLDTAGAIQLRIDQTRSSVFDFTMDNIVEGSFSTFYQDTRGTANRLELVFRDLDNDFALMTKLWNHEPQQARMGRVIPARLHLGNLPQHQAERIGNYLLTRAIDNNLFCRLRGAPASFALLPGDVVRVAHDAAPWSQNAFGDSRFERFEVVEVTENPDETRDFLLQFYSDLTYPDTAGPTQNLIGTNVRRRPQTPPPEPEHWELSAFPRGHVWLKFQIPRGADYRTGDLTLLADLELERVASTLAASLASGDTTAQVASQAGLLVGDFINIGEEILKIVGPGVEGATPISSVLQVARAQKLSEPRASASGQAVYRLAERNLHFVLPPGFTLARALRTHTVDFRPGRLRILHAALRFTNLAGISEAVELPFWAEYEINQALFGTLPGLRASVGGLGTIQVPGPLATGSDLAMPLMLPESVSIGLIYAQAAKSPFGGPIGIQIKIDGVPYGEVGQLPGVITGGPTPQFVWVSGAAKGNVGGKAVSIEITEVGSSDPGEDLTVFVTI